MRVKRKSAIISLLRNTRHSHSVLYLIITTILVTSESSTNRKPRKQEALGVKLIAEHRRTKQPNIQLEHFTRY